MEKKNFNKLSCLLSLLFFISILPVGKSDNQTTLGPFTPTSI